LSDNRTLQARWFAAVFFFVELRNKNYLAMSAERLGAEGILGTASFDPGNGRDVAELRLYTRISMIAR
jgi:hypothetical protein